MTANIEKLTKDLLNNLQISYVKNLWDGSRVTSYARYNYIFNEYLRFFSIIINRSEHYSDLLRQYLRININYEPEELFQLFLIRETMINL